jgi:deoxyribonuclease-4
MEIRLGPAGLPISLEKNRNTIEAIKFLREIGLNAMEIEFVRNIYLDKNSAKEVRKEAEKNNVELSVHAPYFINLLGEKTTIQNSIKRIVESAKIAEILDAKFVVVHAAYYGKYSKEEAYQKMIEITNKILEKLDKAKIKNSKIAYETMAKESQFADLETLLKLKEEINDKRINICIDFAHIFVRNDGKIDYKKILDVLEQHGFKELHTHFSNVKYNLKTKKFQDIHIPINSHPKFEPLAKEIINRNFEKVTIISESPILEKDSLKMKKIFEELGIKIV